jgi:hypothetical protein
MTITVGGSTITFPDSTTQSTAGGPYVGQRSQVFTSSGTFTVPTGVTAVRVTIAGAGGGGSRTNTCGCNGGYQSASGGVGGAAISWITGLTPGGTVAVTVGTGGNSANTGAGGGNTGGTTSFGAYCSATGGTGGTYNGGNTNPQNGTQGSASGGTFSSNLNQLLGARYSNSANTFYGVGVYGGQGQAPSGLVLVEW